MIVIKIGNEKMNGKITWNGYSEGYFESERHAEKYLIDKGYEKDSDEIFFKETEIISDITLLAKVINLPKINVEM